MEPSVAEKEVLRKARLTAEAEEYGWGLWNLTDSTLPLVKRLPTLEALELFETCDAGKVTDRGLAALEGHGALRQLGLGPGVTDGGLAHIARLSTLKRLRLDSAEGVTDAGMKHLSALVGLERLSLQFTNVGDLGLSQLARLTGLRELAINDTRVTDAGLDCLVGMTALEQLSLGSRPSFFGSQGRNRELPEMRDEALLALAACRELRNLTLTGSFTARGLVALQRLPNLQSLTLNSNRLADDAVTVLASLAGLRQLKAIGSFTDEAIARLKAALPQCFVFGMG